MANVTLFRFLFFPAVVQACRVSVALCRLEACLQWNRSDEFYVHGSNFKNFLEPRNRFQGMNSASLCSLAGRYNNPIPTRFLAPIDCLKIPALVKVVEELNHSHPMGIGSADTSRLPKGEIAWPIPTYFQKTQPGSSTVPIKAAFRCAS